MKAEDLFALIGRVRRKTRDPDVLELADYAEKEWYRKQDAKTVASTNKRDSVASTDTEHVASTDCPVCATRRKAKAASMRKWRSGKHVNGGEG